jgi:glutaredoxin
VRKVRLVLYRAGGRFLFFRSREGCRECGVTYAILQRLMGEHLKEAPVVLKTVNWLDDWWRIVWRGGVRAPVLTVNGRVFSQGRIPDMDRLLRRIGSLLGDEKLGGISLPELRRKVRPGQDGGTVVYFSPACPHCRRLLLYLETHGIEYAGHDVTRSESARRRVRELTRSMNIPVTVVNGEVIVGFDRARLRTLLGIEREQELNLAGRRGGIPGLDEVQLQDIAKRAQAVLDSNWLGTWTVPSKHLYPHLWNWDSGFVARGYLHYRPERAYQEMRSLFRGQWRDGFLPHIVFNPSHLDHFPGPDYWQAGRSGRVRDGVHTSGISQPPVHASMIVRAALLDPDRERARSFLVEMYPKLKRLHDFYFDHRDPAGESVVYIVHPWESGLDNSPLWDEPLKAVSGRSRWASRMQKRYDELAEQGKRPKRSYIAQYSYLVENLFRQDYDWHRIAENHPFKVQDVLFNTVLCRAERDLADIGRAVGKDPEPHLRRSGRMREALNRKLWVGEQGLYCAYDLVGSRMINRDTVFSYLPLYAGIPDREDGKRLLNELRSHCFCVADGDCVAIPSYDMCQADFEGEFYWRGPVWVNVNWYLAKGVRSYGDEELASWIEESLITLAGRHGFHEYYDPNTGRGLGAEEFSWTAALIIDLIADREAVYK